MENIMKEIIMDAKYHRPDFEEFCNDMFRYKDDMVYIATIFTPHGKTMTCSCYYPFDGTNCIVNDKYFEIASKNMEAAIRVIKKNIINEKREKKIKEIEKL
jgi:hypothetical protein